MLASIEALEPGDIVEIKYRVWRPAGAGDEVVDRWITAHVIACEKGTWPLLRLADGQATEIRPFMTWRALTGSRRPATIAA
ncbi:hypothetical protein [Hyphomicrobium sp.]|uniref:hypothetical protein n=1 Tax=Hyphomicrobium sp. TaxID=82 RepID=UPI002E30FE90|nr:hypothetical protein [Hyphomicrobium sp.]HEX2842977.1 hypothetical protein [Hyphomicrobium sp.]